MLVSRIQILGRALDKKMSGAVKFSKASQQGLMDDRKKSGHHALHNPIAYLTQSIRTLAEVNAQAVSSHPHLACSHLADSMLGEHHSSCLA